MTVVMSEDRLRENPVTRLSRLIHSEFWVALQRTISHEQLEAAIHDPKNSTKQLLLYIPYSAKDQFGYYSSLKAKMPNLEVHALPQHVTSRVVCDLNSKPGLLALASTTIKDGATGELHIRGLPYIVPGGLYNEFYGWDSYMTALGLLADNNISAAKSIVLHYCFSIEHYGMILNANRTYYLGRSQPPFLTDLALRVYDKIKGEENSLGFLRHAIGAAINEYNNVWMAAPRYDSKTGLSRYYPEGSGVPPEALLSDFAGILQPFAQKNDLDIYQVIKAYNSGTVNEPELDEYFLHDRAARESGHNSTRRFDSKCANLATIDLNSLLYKYEVDIARTISNVFWNEFAVPPQFCTGTVSSTIERAVAWERRHRRRKIIMNKYLWNEAKGMYFDYDIVTQEQKHYESATTFWALWAGLASPKQAVAMVSSALPKFEAYGGLLATTEESRGPIGLNRPQMEWDYPFGWAHHQILAWMGLIRYGYVEEAARLTYKWLFMITKVFVDYNGAVVDMYDVTRPVDAHRNSVQGDPQDPLRLFKGVNRTG
jgi:alpha,alpha-trehalase